MSNWTPSQQKAIDAINHSTIVSAAAGSGKTSVLVQRVINMIVDEKSNVSADKLLVVTYTRAAASELKERLRKALNNKLKENPGNKYLIEQQLKLQKANISTIHSFCSSLSREFFYVLDIDRDFKIADESELVILKSEALKMTFDELYGSEDESFRFLLDNFITNRDDKALRETILKLYTFLCSHPFPEYWMEEKLKYYEEKNVSNTIWFKEIILPYTIEISSYIKDVVDDTKSLLFNCTETLGFALKRNYENLKDVSVNIENAIKTENWEVIRIAVFSYRKEKLNTPRGYKDDYLKNAIEINKKSIESALKDLNDIYAFSESSCEEDIQLLSKIAKELFYCVKKFSDNFALLKKNKKLADYSDLEHWAINLLYDEPHKLSELALELRDRYDQILVDEYQDANETQDSLFKGISKDEKNLFVVGDVKQSIYGFRQAMPEIFLERKNRAENTDDESECIILEKNFRSSKVILDFVNYIFSKLMTKTVGEIDYNEKEALVHNDNGDDESLSSVDFDILDMDKSDEDNVNRLEAKYIAKKINEIINSDFRVKDRINNETIYRKAMPKDFCVLMRSESKYAPIYVETLIRYGIPAYSDKSYSFLESYEVMVILNLLKIIDNPTLDIELLSVLMSPLFGFTADDMARIRLDDNKRHMSLFSAVKVDAENGNIKSKTFLEELEFYRNECVSKSLADLISVIFERSSFVSIISASSDGNIEKANLRLLQIYARDYEMNTHKGLTSFVSYINKLKDNESDLQGGVDLDASKDDAVKVMSVHSSKGLEFPVVFFANANKRFSTDSNDSVLWDSKYGFAIKRKDNELDAMYETFIHLALKFQRKKTEMSEELRVLYVALTRPKQKLIILSTPKSKDDESDDTLQSHLQSVVKNLNSGSDISPYIVKKSSASINWLTMCALLHPDGKILRDLIEYSAPLYRGPEFSMNVNIVDDFSNESTEKTSTYKEESDVIDVENILDKRLNFEYPYQGILDVPSKFTATELAHRDNDFYYSKILRKPDFISGGEYTGIRYGTLFHNVIEHIDFNNAKTNLDSEINRMVDKGYITEEDSLHINKEKINQFINSDIVKRIIDSKKVLREYEFINNLDIDEVIPQRMEYSGKYENATTTLIGRVDMAFYEEDGIVIVDYKTDKVDDEEKLKKMYTHQLEVYKKAINEVLNVNVKECYIYSVYLGKSIKVG